MSGIVLPTDFSPLARGAIPWACRMAEALKANIHCLHVVREEQYYGGLDMVLPASMPTSQELLQAAEEQLREYTKRELAEWEGRVVHSAKLGTPFVEIVRYARDTQATMIVMSTHGRSGLTHMLMGSTTESVVRKASCPVLSIRSPDLQFEMP
jgi:nucleotide-binding universal stress UspA family protein